MNKERIQKLNHKKHTKLVNLKKTMERLDHKINENRAIIVSLYVICCELIAAIRWKTVHGDIQMHVREIKDIYQSDRASHG